MFKSSGPRAEFWRVSLRAFHGSTRSQNSQEEFDAFGPTLMPILTGLGVEVAEPVVGRVHNTIEG